MILFKIVPWLPAVVSFAAATNAPGEISQITPSITALPTSTTLQNLSVACPAQPNFCSDDVIMGGSSTHITFVCDSKAIPTVVQAVTIGTTVVVTLSIETTMTTIKTSTSTLVLTETLPNFPPEDEDGSCSSSSSSSSSSSDSRSFTLGFPGFRWPPLPFMVTAIHPLPIIQPSAVLSTSSSPSPTPLSSNTYASPSVFAAKSTRNTDPQQQPSVSTVPGGFPSKPYNVTSPSPPMANTDMTANKSAPGLAPHAKRDVDTSAVTTVVVVHTITITAQDEEVPITTPTSPSPSLPLTSSISSSPSPAQLSSSLASSLSSSSGSSSTTTTATFSDKFPEDNDSIYPGAKTMGLGGHGGASRGAGGRMEGLVAAAAAWAVAVLF